MNTYILIPLSGGQSLEVKAHSIEGAVWLAQCGHYGAVEFEAISTSRIV